MNVAGKPVPRQPPAGVGFQGVPSLGSKLMARTDRALTPPPDSVVLLFHQGYAFAYLRALGGFDQPVFQYTEGEREPREAASSFARFVEAELCLMEQNAAKLRDQGGYYLTVHRAGGTTESYPALDSGDRPLDRVVSRH